MTSQMILPNPWIAIDEIDKRILEQKSHLMEKLYKSALEDLREDDNTREQCLQHLREWIKQNSDIQNCLTDDRFLLKFLRIKKYSLPMAQQCLLKYLNFRKRFKHYMHDADCRETRVNELISSGYIYVSPFRDSKGRRVIIYDLSKFDPQKYNNVDMAKVHVVTYESVADEEDNQIMGVNHVANLNGASPAFISLWSIAEFTTIVRWGEQSFPMRHKEINLLNLPLALKYVYDFLKSNVSQKLRERFVIHDSIADLTKKVDRRCLPKELGGEMPAQEMIALWKKELERKRQRLLSYDDMILLSDRGIITRSKAKEDNTGVGSLPGSFRKLEVD